MKLHVGCGTNKIPGWVNIDSVANCNPDLVHDLAKPLPYGDQVADELKAEGVLEHFDKYMRYVVVGDWVRVLKVGGLIHLELPDFKKILFNRYFKFKFDDLMDTIFGENLWESKIYIGHFGNHKWGYSPKSLTAFMRQLGFEPVSVISKGLNIRYTGRKARHIMEKEMDAWLIHSHNNKFGANSADVPLGIIKQRIKEFQSS